MPKIEFKNVNFSYRSTRKKEGTDVFNNLSISFVKDSFNVIIGPSGCGKTTLLRMISGFIDDYEGDIFINDINTDNLSVAERSIAYIDQNYVLYPHLTVFDNIAFPLKSIKAPREEIIERVNEVTEALDLVPTLSRKPKYLSGGQRQKAALAKGLVKNASLYLFDEPLSHIEQSKRLEQRIFIKNMVKKHQSTAIYVTHDFVEALALADYLYVMDQGQIVVHGTPKEVLESGNEIVNDFIKAVSTGNNL